MPRLLLVDDNPSIHRIAETLLATSDVELVSCGSGAQAMAMVHQGDHFDVALLDTSMAGMDGWALLKQLRETSATARMPVAMMAGVLDVVDPERLRLAPIQGFLKKPVELRDLGDRVRRLMETPVPPPPEPEPEPTAFQIVPAPGGSEAPGLPAAEDDLLLLGPEDLAAEAPEEAAHPAPTPEPLDLEELDLESLQSLTFAPGAGPAPEETGSAPVRQAPSAPPAPEYAIPEFLLADTLPEEAMDAGPVFTDHLPDLGPALDQPIGAGSHPEGPAGALDLGEPIDWSDGTDAMVGIAAVGQAPSAFEAEPAPAAATPKATQPGASTHSDSLEPSVNAAPAEAGSAGAGADPLAALLSDPVLMDRLARALVERLGDQVLREIAWEVMPELAERLRRQEAP